MAGISDKALKTNYAENKYRYNKGSELQNKEFSDGTGLEMYETQLRELDPQLGRWWQADPKTDQAYESVSPYNAMNDDPARYNDPNGDEGEEASGCCKELWENIKTAAVVTTVILTNSLQQTQGAGTNAAQAVTNSVGSTLNGMLNSVTAGAWPTDPAATLGFGATANQSAVMMGQLGGAFLPSPTHATPDLQLAPVASNALTINASGFIPALPSLKVDAQGGAPSLKDQANDLKNEHNNGKNSVAIQTPDKQIRYDLAGKAHNGVETPHFQVYNKNFVNGVMKNKSKATKDPVPFTQKDLRLVRKYFENLKKNNP